MIPARRSPSARTLGIQLVTISTVLALMARMFLTASSPLPVIASSRNATTMVILARIEVLVSMAGVSSGFERVGIAQCDRAAGRQMEAMPAGIRPCRGCTRVNLSHRRTTEEPDAAGEMKGARDSAHQSERIGKEFRATEIA